MKHGHTRAVTHCESTSWRVSTGSHSVGTMGELVCHLCKISKIPSCRSGKIMDHNRSVIMNLCFYDSCMSATLRPRFILMTDVFTI